MKVQKDRKKKYKGIDRHKDINIGRQEEKKIDRQEYRKIDS